MAESQHVGTQLPASHTLWHPLWPLESETQKQEGKKRKFIKSRWRLFLSGRLDNTGCETCTCTNLRKHVHTHMHAHTSAHIHTCTHTHAHMSTHTHMHTHTHTCIHTGMHACMHACTHVHAHTHVHTHTHTHTQMCTHTHTRAHTHTYTQSSTLELPNSFNFQSTFSIPCLGIYYHFKRTWSLYSWNHNGYLFTYHTLGHIKVFHSSLWWQCYCLILLTH